MRNKGRKIKRYKGSFDTKQFRRKKLIRWIVLLLLLFAASYFLARPILDWGTHLWYFGLKGQSETPESQSQTTEQTPQPEPTATPTPTPTPQPDGDWATVSLQSVATAELAQQTAQQLAAQNVKYAVVTLKAQDGTVTYASGVEKAAVSLSQTPIDAAAVTDAFKQQGIVPVAEIWAFQDPKAAYNDRDMAVQYAGETAGVLWLDNSADAGGKPWLNPYSATARQYVQDLAVEATEMGYETILFNGVQMPQVYSLAYASFGDTAGKTYDAALNECIEQWQTALEQKATCWFQYSAAAVTGEDLRAAGVATGSLAMQNLVVQLPADTADPVAVLQAAADAANGKSLICRLSTQPDDALRQAAQQNGYQIMVG